MAAFIEVTACMVNGIYQKQLVNVAEIRKISPREPADTGTNLVWAHNHGEYGSPQLHVTESYEQVSAMIGWAESIIVLVDGEPTFRSIP